ncbi:MAG: flagellar hook-associated protein [Frankiales bacterium]|nr:flagellar hook-associated protein [Frankiales bacterium]
MASVISGLGSGIDLQGMVTQLMTAERAPETQMNTLRMSALSAQSAWSTLSDKMTALKTAAAALDTTTLAQASTAVSGDSTTVTATATAAAQLGSFDITVNQLATAQQLASSPLASSTMLVGAGQLVLSAGLTTVGAGAISVDDSTPEGVHSVTISQASAKATAVGSSSPSLSFAPGGDDLTVTLADGTSQSLTLSSYATVNDLVAALRTGLNGVAGVDLVAGQLQISSRDEGSDATLTLSGGALSDLGLGFATTATGQDAVLSVDGGPSTTVTHLDGSTSVPLDSGITLTSLGHLGAGTVSTNVVRTTDSSTLLDLRDAISRSGSPASASTFDTGDGSTTPTRFVLSATSTGSAGALTVDSSGISVLDPSLLTTITAAQDAQLTVGGATVTRSSNSISDLVPGVTLGLVKATPVAGPPTTVTVSRDAAATADKVKALVDAANALITTIGTQTAYNATAKTSGPLAGDGGARALAGSVVELFGNTLGTGVTKVLSQLGIQTSRDGTLTFDATAFSTQVKSDPDGASSLISAFATSLEDFAKGALDTNGVVTTGISSAGTEAQRRQDQIDAFEVRMTALQASYSARFSALDAALGVLKQQQTQLASQIGGLPIA